MTDLTSGCARAAAIILAAGASTRMARPKQLLPFSGGTLLGSVIDAATQAHFAPVIVVVGAGADAIQASIASKPVTVVRNANWTSGMGLSIAAGVNYLRNAPADNSAAVAILTCDQPFVTAGHLAAMRRMLFTSGASAVAAEYSGTLGVPAFFKRELFGRLASLPPECGAKLLFADPAVKVASFALPEAAIDIDTPEDFRTIAPT
ncbi:MAG: nucleotidyltransferase family protein [Acidobacteriaceae bacterium]|nr:nucleotidyltransferase family protein [Acidobacteriaceae bacterium]